VKDGEFTYPEHPEESMPAWMLELYSCPVCGYVDPESIPSWAEWGGGECTCGKDDDEEESL
jgi:hypothetical protein